ncbi:MAG TPA: bacterial transcriptional activator domain-containing protein [Mycobacteriales bacterium]|nr:bacterial transcriptional activator domain-containing protein [Mycobacteriales bacterium]
MTRPMTGAPLERVHRVRRRGEVTRGLLAGLVAAVVLLGVPAALLLALGDPVPIPAGHRTGPSAARIVLDVAACLVWLGWAQFVSCLLVEVVAGVRGTGLPARVWFAAAVQQELARRLVTPMLLLAATQGLRSAPRPTSGPEAPEAPAAFGGPGGLGGVGVVESATSRPPTAGPGGGIAGIAWDVAGVGLLAAGLVDALREARQRTARTRRPGVGVPLPDAEAAGVEVAAWLGADLDGATFLDHALRALAAGLGTRGRPVPEFYAARMSADRLDLLLVTPDSAPPPPFTVEDAGARWSLLRQAALPPVERVPAPLPGLVSIGGTGTDIGAGASVLVDLESVGGTVAIDGDLDAARSLVAAAAVELATAAWSRDARITLVGFGHALEPLGSGRLRCVDTLAEVAADLVARVSASRRALTASGIDSVLTGRIRGLAGGDCTPDLVLLAGPGGPADLADLAALESCARACVRAPLGILVAGPTPSARVRFTVDERGALRAGPFGDLPAPHQLTARSYSGLARLLRAAAHTDSDTAVPPVPGRPPGGAVGVVGGIDSVDPDAPVGVLLRILGEPAADGPGLASPGTALAVEICVFVALRGRASLDEVAAAVWPYGIAGTDRDATVHRVRDWLGRSPDGDPRLRWDGPTLTLSGDVRLDWHLFVALARRGGGDLRRALDLVRGPFAEPRPARRYAWLAADPARYQAGPHVVDVAHRHWRSCLDAGDLDAAVTAAEAGLRAEPVAEALWEDLAVAVRARDGDAAAADLLRTRRGC